MRGNLAGVSGSNKRYDVARNRAHIMVIVNPEVLDTSAEARRVLAKSAGCEGDREGTD
jgi:hypothetical protein